MVGHSVAECRGSVCHDDLPAGCLVDRNVVGAAAGANDGPTAGTAARLPLIKMRLPPNSQSTSASAALAARSSSVLHCAIERSIPSRPRLWQTQSGTRCPSRSTSATLRRSVVSFKRSLSVQIVWFSDTVCRDRVCVIDQDGCLIASRHCDEEYRGAPRPKYGQRVRRRHDNVGCTTAGRCRRPLSSSRPSPPYTRSSH